MKTYMSRAGTRQFKPSIEELESMDENMEGFCLACGEVQPGVEPDARKCVCDCCGKAKVYGASELALMGLYH